MGREGLPANEDNYLFPIIEGDTGLQQSNQKFFSSRMA
jgi:hypothetical protein